jgi:hypothetical protein
MFLTVTGKISLSMAVELAFAIFVCGVISDLSVGDRCTTLSTFETCSTI